MATPLWLPGADRPAPDHQILAESDGPSPVPIDAHTAATDLYPASGVLVLNLDGPTNGWLWLVRSVVVGSLSSTSFPAGRCDLFVSGADLRVFGRSGVGLVGLPLSDWRDVTPGLPNTAFYDGRQLTLRHPEKLFAVISSGSAGVGYSAAAHFETYEEAAYRMLFAL